MILSDSNKEKGLASSPLIESDSISYAYDELAVIKAASLRVQPGESVAIIGPSGAGKSTLLRVVLGLEPPASGNAKVYFSPSEVGAAFQEDSLLPWLTVRENVLLLHSLHNRSLSPNALDEVLRSASLQEFASFLPRQLSTGMKQRVALCRLLAYSPKLYVLDEAMANIDDFSRFRICDELFGRVVAQGCSILFITHNLTDALHLADRVLITSPRPLTITAEFKNPLPRSRRYDVRFTADFHKALEELQSCASQL